MILSLNSRLDDAVLILTTQSKTETEDCPCAYDVHGLIDRRILTQSVKFEVSLVHVVCDLFLHLTSLMLR